MVINILENFVYSIKYLSTIFNENLVLIIYLNILYINIINTQ